MFPKLSDCKDGICKNKKEATPLYLYAIPTCYMARPPFLFVRVALHSPALAATIYRYSYILQIFSPPMYPLQIKLFHLEYRLFELGSIHGGSLHGGFIPSTVSPSFRKLLGVS